MKYSNLPTLNTRYIKNCSVLLHVNLDALNNSIHDVKLSRLSSTIKSLLDNKNKIVILPVGPKISSGNIEEFSVRQQALNLSSSIPERRIYRFVPFNSLEKFQNLILNHEFGFEQGDVTVLENTYINDKTSSFNVDEQNCNSELSADWCNLADFYVEDNFADLYHDLSSNAGIIKQKSDRLAIGDLIQDEIKHLNDFSRKMHSLHVVFGADATIEQINTLELVLKNTKQVLVCGQISLLLIACTNSRFQSYFGANELDLANSIWEKYKKRLILPCDFICKNKTDTITNYDVNSLVDVSSVIGIGEKTLSTFLNVINDAKSMVLYGNIDSDFISCNATKAILKKLANEVNDRPTIILIDGAKILYETLINLGLSQKFTYISTGSISSLYVIFGKRLPILSLFAPKKTIFNLF